MTMLWVRLKSWIEADGNAALITLISVEGSAPREAGTRMIMRADGQFSGTIGGGALEWQALAEAQKLVSRHSEGVGQRARHALGPALGQCCGGRVELSIEVFAGTDLAWITPLSEAERRGPFETQSHKDARGVLIRTLVTMSTTGPTEAYGEVNHPLILFGAGHIGRALVLALAPLPFTILWCDGRADAFPVAVPSNVKLESSGDPEAILAAAPPDAFILAMTHSHALDLAIMDRALRGDFPYIGVIGSATKRARFLSRLRDSGHDNDALGRLICPIGLETIRSKHPAAIAAGVAADLLIRHEAIRSARSIETPFKAIQGDFIHVRA